LRLPGARRGRSRSATALRTVSAAFAINDVTGAPGFLVEMANGGVAVESFHVQVRCAHVY
jgi:hypothetical protein